MRQIVIGVLAVLLTTIGDQAAAAALQAPNETDLRAAYCLTATKEHLKSLKAPDDAKIRGEVKARNRRLAAYLKPRLRLVDRAPIKAAQVQRLADSAEARRQMHANGSLNCPTTSPEALAGCLLPLAMATKSSQKYLMCRDLSWLPAD